MAWACACSLCHLKIKNTQIKTIGSDSSTGSDSLADFLADFDNVVTESSKDVPDFDNVVDLTVWSPTFAPDAGDSGFDYLAVPHMITNTGALAFAYTTRASSGCDQTRKVWVFLRHWDDIWAWNCWLHCMCIEVLRIEFPDSSKFLKYFHFYFIAFYLFFIFITFDLFIQVAEHLGIN